jgi:hypothetical protein
MLPIDVPGPDTRCLPARVAAWLAAASGWAVAAPVAALGLGPAPGSVAFGQPLDLEVPLRLEDGETLPAGCMRATVTIGERRLPAASVAVQADPAGKTLRVRSADAVHEPTVEVLLQLGCSPTIERRLVLLADPATSAAGPGSATAGQGPPRAGPPREPADPSAVVPTRPRFPSAAPVAGAHGPASSVPRQPAIRPAPATKPPATPIEPVAAAGPGTAAARPGSTADPAAAGVESAQIAALRSELQQLQVAAAADRREIAQLRERLAGAGTAGLDPAQAWGTSLLLMAFAWAGWRLFRRRFGQPASRLLLARAGAMPGATVSDGNLPALARASAFAPASALEGPVSGGYRDSTALRPGEAGRGFGIDELIDLEQQAEFFVALGDDASAVALLEGNLEDQAHTGPLPLLKLLEIRRRKGEPAACDRLLAIHGRRIGTRPGAAAAIAAGGQGLLAHPPVLDALQRDWSSPEQAMRLIERLLLPADDADVFDLQTYRDLLLLYTVARDLHRQGDTAARTVDVLLPLRAGTDAPASGSGDLDLDLGALEDSLAARSGRQHRPRPA